MLHPFTQGQCVQHNETFADSIRRVLPRTVNLGYSANGPLLALASFTEYAVPLQPRAVVWFFFEGNDLQNLEIEKRDPILMAYLDGRTQDLRRLQTDIDRDLTSFAEDERQNEIANFAAWEERQARLDSIEAAAPRSVRSSGVVRFVLATELRKLLGQMVTTTPAPTEEQGAFDQTTLRAILSMVKETAESWGGRFQMVYLPDWASVADGTPFNPHYHRIVEIAAEVGVPLVEVLPMFAAQPDPLALFALRRSAHYTAQAHHLIAEAVLEAFVDTVLEPRFRVRE